MKPILNWPFFLNHVKPYYDVNKPFSNMSVSSLKHHNIQNIFYNPIISYFHHHRYGHFMLIVIGIIMAWSELVILFSTPYFKIFTHLITYSICSCSLQNYHVSLKVRFYSVNYFSTNNYFVIFPIFFLSKSNLIIIKYFQIGTIIYFLKYFFQKLIKSNRKKLFKSGKINFEIEIFYRN